MKKLWGTIGLALALGTAACAPEKTATDGEQPPGLLGQVRERVRDGRRKRGDPVRVRVIRDRQGGGALQPGQQLGRTDGIQAGQGEPHRQRVAV